MPDVIFPLRNAYRGFTEVIDSLSGEQFLSPMTDWAPRDVVAHLIGWNRLMIEASVSILAGQAPAYYEDAPNDYSNINSSFTRRYASRSKQELLAELRASLETFETFLYDLPPEELGADHGVLHYRGSSATVAKIIHSLADDYRYHADEIKEWLAGNQVNEGHESKSS